MLRRLEFILIFGQKKYESTRASEKQRVVLVDYFKILQSIKKTITKYAEFVIFPCFIIKRLLGRIIRI